MVRSELGKNLLTAAEAALASDTPWKVRDMSEVIEFAPIPAYERGAIESIINSGVRSKAKEIYHESFTKYMFGQMALEDVRRNAQTLGKHTWEVEETKRRYEQDQQLAQQLAARRVQIKANDKLNEMFRMQQARQNYKSPQMFGQLGASDQGIYNALTDSYNTQR